MCAAAAYLEKEREDAKIHKFLFGLDEVRFNAIQSQIIDEDPLPDLNIVTTRKHACCEGNLREKMFHANSRQFCNGIARKKKIKLS